jgi:N-acetylglucosaminyldiphosphoundecaprenol N-acetyl-beta-D-mannosaminyltransferase
MLRRVRVLGVKVVAATFDEAIKELTDSVVRGDRSRAHFATAHMLVEANDDPELDSVLNDANFVFPDGLPIVWMVRARAKGVQRVCGPDALPAICARSVALGHSHYFYGGGPGVAYAVGQRMAARFPGLRIAGSESPPFRALTSEEDEEVVARINSSGANYVWIGLGSPKQERWLAEHRARLDANLLLAVGAAFDFHAGVRRRAPVWMQRMGMEWLFRLIAEPRRLARRYTITNARFVALAFRDLRATGERSATSD